MSTSSSSASSRRSLTTTWLNSDWASSSPSAVRSRASTWSGVSVPRPTSRVRSASRLGGAMNTWSASGIASRTCRAPWTSISRTTGSPRRSRPSSSAAQGPVAPSRVGGVLDELAVGDALLELVGAEEVVVDALRLPGPGRRASWPRPTGRAPARARAGRGSASPCPTPDGPVITKTLATGRSGAWAQRRRSSATSSPRWRSERPPRVLLGEIRHWPRILLTFTRPYLGTASSRSKTLAVCR